MTLKKLRFFPTTNYSQLSNSQKNHFFIQDQFYKTFWLQLTVYYEEFVRFTLTYIFTLALYFLWDLQLTEHNDAEPNDTQHNNTQHNDTQHNDTQHNDT